MIDKVYWYIKKPIPLLNTVQLRLTRQSFPDWSRDTLKSWHIFGLEYLSNCLLFVFPEARSVTVDAQPRALYSCVELSIKSVSSSTEKLYVYVFTYYRSP